MNLAICHPAVVPVWGGCDTYVAELIRRLSGDGHTVHLYASTWDASALPPAVQIHSIPPKSWPRFLHPWRFSRACQQALQNAGHDLTIGFDMAADVDVLYPQGGLQAAAVGQGLLISRSPLQRGVARVLRSMDLGHHASCAFERRQYGRDKLPFLIVNSDLVRRHFYHYLGIPAARIAVLHGAIDPDPFAATDRPARRAHVRHAWKVDPSDTVALFMAMNYRLHGLEPLLRAVGRMPNRSRFRLVVIGPPATASYEKLAMRLGVADVVRFAGFLPDLANAYFGADLLVHPTFYDSCSRVVQEAMACGLPVITSQFNGASEVMDPPHDGLVVRDPHDCEELAGALGYFLDSGRRQSCARAALRCALKWTFDDHCRLFLKLLDEALRRKRAA